MRIVALVQARMSSTRLPGKVLAELAGHPMLHHVLTRARAAHHVDHVALATTTAAVDDPLVEFCAAEGYTVYRGSEEDVLDRFYGAARATDADVVVRITADCPFLDPSVVDLVVGDFMSGGVDYVSNTIERRFPDGLDTEVFSRAALDRAWRDARLASEREHVTPYIWKHPEIFPQRQVLQDTDYSALRWTVDELRDLEFARAVYAALGNRVFGQQDILALLAARPELTAMNEGIPSNEGYDKSLRDDTIVHPERP